ncbi:hypothetical protein [Pseudarthrobacter sp. N5]|uniref:hypothetical protein n=1 Tax=Pseudarthrobacter sp. N5 TaxID=3418416 RepID=UPI003CEC607B
MTTKGWIMDNGRRGAKTAALTAILSLAIGTGGAYAYWTSTGAGTGSAANGTMQTVTVEAFVSGDSPQSTLVPEGTAETILRVTNPNPYTVQVYSVSPNGPATADSTHTGCTTTGVTFTGTAAPTTPAVYVAANSTALITLPGTAAMDSTSQSACQGATFHLPVTLAVRK